MEAAPATQNRRSRGQRAISPGNHGSDLRQAGYGAVVCCPRLGGGDRHQRPPNAKPARRARPGRVARRRLGGSRPWRSQRAAAASRARTRTSPPATSRWRSTRRQFATHQRLAETNDLQLEIENTGDKQVPRPGRDDLHGRREIERLVLGALRPARARRPNRPVWILENGFPKVAKQNETGPELDELPPGGAEAAQTDTFSFGPLDPGERRNLVWRVTPVVAGTYTVHYELAAGLNGKAKAVTDDGGRVEGEFVVTVSDKPPQARVDDSG